MNAASWCVGMPPQGPHVPDDQALIDTNIGPNIKLCRRCWERWIRTDTDNTKAAHNDPGGGVGQKSGPTVDQASR